MRRVFLASLAAATCGVVVAACSSSGGGAKGHGEMTSGVYTISNYTPGTDTCHLNGAPADVNGQTFIILVTNGTLAIPFSGGDSATGPYDAGVFDSKFSGDIDFSGNGFDCVITENYEFKGASTAPDAADANEAIHLIQKSGTQCTDVLTQITGQAVTLPCDSKDTQHVEKTGPVPPPPQTVTGTIVTTTGYGTTLSGDYFSKDTNSTLKAHVTAGSFTFDLLDNFQCYSATATGTTYELGTYDAFTYVADITTADWAVGSVPLGAANTLSFDLFDASGNELQGSATGGSVTLSAAPMTTGAACSFGGSAIPISGTVYPAAFAPSAVHGSPALDLQAKARLGSAKAKKLKH